MRGYARRHHPQETKFLKCIIADTLELFSIATLTASLLPHGPCAHFRLTSVQLHRQISGSANPTSHIPELVLSNFSTPLGLSTGRLIQSLFPPLPQIIGRQVVAIHNQRDYIFIRRFRYMFALREGESSVKAAIAQGRDKDLRTKMQEIGPRFTLKLRWLQKNALGTNRRKGGNGLTKDTLLDENEQKDVDVEGMEGVGREQTKGEKEDEAAARKEMLDGLGEEDVPLPLSQDEDVPLEDDADAPQPEEEAEDAAALLRLARPATSSTATETEAAFLSKAAPNNNKKRKRRTTSPNGTIHIPDFSSQIPSELPKKDLPHARKLKKGASILDSLAVTVGYGRGGARKDKKEWEWNPRMQVSRRKFAL